MRKLILLSAGMMLTLVGCQTVPYQGQARDVKKKPQVEGVIAIPMNARDEDRAVANQKMQSNCAPSTFSVLEEGEVAIGQKTDSSASENRREGRSESVGSLFGIPIVSSQAPGKDTSSSQTTTQIKEWQISYKCIAEGGKKGSRVQ